MGRQHHVQTSVACLRLHAHSCASSQGALPGAPLAACWSSGCLAGRAPDDQCRRRAGTGCSSAGRQGALPGAPLMTDAADVQAQVAPALAVRVPCLVRPWRPLSSAWSSRRAAASHVPRNAGRQGALPGAPLAAGAADRAAAVHWTRTFPVMQLALSHQGSFYN